jgi:hypothetical protein
MDDDILDDLLAALREVSEASDPDSIADSDSDEEEAEDELPDDQDGSQSFVSPKVFNIVMLLERLEKESEQKQLEQRRSEARQQRIKQQATKLQEKNDKLMQLRWKAAEAESELKLNRQLEIQSKRLDRARLELYKANKTVQDRMELDADTKLMANWASRYCAEAGTDWRERASAAFQSKKL